MPEVPEGREAPGGATANVFFRTSGDPFEEADGVQPKSEDDDFAGNVKSPLNSWLPDLQRRVVKLGYDGDAPWNYSTGKLAG